MSVSDCAYHWLEVSMRTWTEDTNLSAVAWVKQTSGAGYASVPQGVVRRPGPMPDLLTLTVHGDGGSHTSRVFGENNVDMIEERLADGTDGFDDELLPVPPAYGTDYKPFRMVRLMRADNADSEADGKCVFMGLVTGLTYDLGSDTWTVIVSEIARWHMNKIPVRGEYIFKPEETGDDQHEFIENTLPTFNPQGRPNQYYNDSDEAQNQFINCDFNAQWNPDADPQAYEQVTGGTGYARSWTYGSILNYLRDQYNQEADSSPQTKGFGAISTNLYLDWEECSSTYWDFLNTDPDSEKPNRAADLTIGGMSLAEVIDALVTRAGPYSWYCSWDEDQDKYVLHIYDTQEGETNQTTQQKTNITLARGKPNADVSTSEPDVVGGQLSWSWDDSLTQIKALGAKKRLEISVDTTAGTLVQGWDASENATYRGDGDKNTQKFQAFFQRFTIAKDIDWSTWFSTDAYYDGPREPLPYLLSTVKSPASDGSLHRTKINLLAWRYKDSAWEPAPDGVGCTIHPDGSIWLTGRAKDDSARWADDGSSGYPIRVTLAVEMDERLTTSTSPIADSGVSDWPTIEGLADSPDNIYEARVLAYLPNDGATGPQPVLDNPTSTDELGTATGPDIIRDDSESLEAEANRTLRIFAAPRLTGTVEVYYILEADWDYYPGVIIRELEGGGDREDMIINAVVNNIQFTELDSERQTVVYGLEE